jgi:hypothetical protein
MFAAHQRKFQCAGFLKINGPKLTNKLSSHLQHCSTGLKITMVWIERPTCRQVVFLQARMFDKAAPTTVVIQLIWSKEHGRKWEGLVGLQSQQRSNTYEKVS